VNIMEVLLVIAGVLLFVRLVGFVALVVADRREPVRPPGRRTDPCLGPVQALPPQAPRTSAGCGRPEPSAQEADLLARLRAGRIGREQYRAAMAELAGRDAHAHPLRAPSR
jgi:hypothetical protein